MHLYRHIVRRKFFSSLIICLSLSCDWAHLFVFLGFEPPLYTQLFSSSCVTPPVLRDVSCFLSPKLMHNFGAEKLNPSKFNEQFSEKYTSISIKERKLIQNRKSYQKVRRLVRWYLYLLSIVYNFCIENETMFYWL